MRPGFASNRVRLGFLVLLLAGACASPVGVSVAKPRAVHRYLTRNALSSDEPSSFSQIELRRYDLLDAFHDDPDATLGSLRRVALDAGLPPDALFALAELSFLRAEKTRDAGRYAAAALYAWAFLFPEEPRAALDPLDPRGRIAADVYNRSLASALRRDATGIVVARPEGLDLPFGHFHGRRGPPPDLGGYAIENVYPVAELEVRGLRNRYRRPGIGAPLAARLEATPASASQPVPLTPNAHMPLTLVMRVEDPLAQIRGGDVTGEVDVYPSLDVDTIEVDGREVPLEAEPTAALASGLSESRFWKQELGTFLGDLIGVRGKSGLSAIRPYRHGRIPVVFVHGTASSGGRWADMVNDLLAGPNIRHRFSFWFFHYDSGNPIAYSAWQLRDGLMQAVARGDPTGTDPCLRDMVVLGHSQGGLLTKMTVIDSGDAFWNNLSRKPFGEAELSPADRKLVQEALFVKPLPFVSEVIFLATPHRGSYLAGPQLVRRLAERLVRLPGDLVRLGAELATLAPPGGLTGERIPTSIDNMSPGNPFIKTLASIPVSPGVTAHSIIAVNDDEPLEKAGDGVVKYESAHIEGVASELIVHSPHSGMQDKAETIEEVRRILLEHAERSRCSASAGSASAPGNSSTSY